MTPYKHDNIKHMVEIHPFGNFVPPKVKYLILGSFTTKPMKGYEWFYANGRNQFWPIMESVYGLELKTKKHQQELFINLEIALADIILSCERRKNSNLDVNLFNCVYNVPAVKVIIAKHKIKKIFFTSRHVEDLFKKLFKDIINEDMALVCLPSPSPRYAMLTKEEKVKKYLQLLPKLP